MPTLLPRFTIEQPKTGAEVSQMLLAYGDGACVYAGGTELLLAMKLGAVRYERLVDIKAVPGLDTIEERDGALRIGALVTHRALERSPLIRARLPVLAALEAGVANPRVRATGTVGGNLCFAEPRSDPATLLLCLDAQVHAVGPGTDRRLGLGEFLVGPYQVALAAGEFLEALTIPRPAPGQRAAYCKFQVHERPLLGLALAFELDDSGEEMRRTRVAVGSVSPTPRRSTAAEDLLRGARRDVERLLGEAADVLADDAALLDDVDGSADYKRQLIRALLRRAYEAARQSRHG